MAFHKLLNVCRLDAFKIADIFKRYFMFSSKTNNLSRNACWLAFKNIDFLKIQFCSETTVSIANLAPHTFFQNH